MVKKYHTKKVFRKDMTFLRKARAGVKGIDMFGKTISLTYKGDEQFKTIFGGIASIVIGLTIFVYITYLFVVLFQKSNTTVTATSIVDDIFSDVIIHRPGENSFDFAVQFEADGVDYMNDPTAFTIDITQIEQEWDSTSEESSFERTFTSLDLQKCGDNGFQYAREAEIKRVGINEFYCPTRRNYTVAGSFYAKSFHYLELKVQKCQGDGCRPEEEIENIMKEGRFSLALVNSLFDSSNYDQPIQRVIDDAQFWELTPGIRKKTDVMITYNEAELQDDYFQLGGSQTLPFYQVLDWVDRFELESDNGEVLNVYFRIDKITNYYNRRIYSFGEVVGQAGGFYGALLSLGAMIVTLFSKRMFVAGVLNKIYQIDTWQEQEQLSKNERPNFDAIDEIESPSKSI